MIVLRNNGVQLLHTFYVDGVSTAADGQVTVHITNGDGTDLVAAGAVATHESDGQYSYPLDPQANLNLLTVTWTGTFSGVVQSQSDTVEIVGGVYVTLAELRTVPGLESSATYSNDTLVATRAEFEEMAENYCGKAFVPRYQRDHLIGYGGTAQLLSKWPVRTILSATSTDTSGVVTTFDTTNWIADRTGLLTTDSDSLTASTIYGQPNLWVAYEHGEDQPSRQLVRACKLYVQWQLLRDTSQIGRDIRSISDPAGFNTSYSLPDWDAGRPTGIGEIDTALNSIGRRAPAIA